MLMDFVRRASPREMMDVRSMIKPAAAAMAAVRATREDLDIMEGYLCRADAAQTLETLVHPTSGT
jgi:DNA-binding FadR family transcriptional regulator